MIQNLRVQAFYKEMLFKPKNMLIDYLSLFLI